MQVRRRLADRVTPPDKVVMTRISVAAGAVWPLLVVGLIELSAVMLLAKTVSNGARRAEFCLAAGPTG